MVAFIRWVCDMFVVRCGFLRKGWKHQAFYDGERWTFFRDLDSNPKAYHLMRIWGFFSEAVVWILGGSVKALLYAINSSMTCNMNIVYSVYVYCIYIYRNINLITVCQPEIYPISYFENGYHFKGVDFFGRIHYRSMNSLDHWQERRCTIRNPFLVI